MEIELVVFCINPQLEVFYTLHKNNPGIETQVKVKVETSEATKPCLVSLEMSPSSRIQRLDLFLAVPAERQKQEAGKEGEQRI